MCGAAFLAKCGMHIFGNILGAKLVCQEEEMNSLNDKFGEYRTAANFPQWRMLDFSNQPLHTERLRHIRTFLWLAPKFQVSKV